MARRAVGLCWSFLVTPCMEAAAVGRRLPVPVNPSTDVTNHGVYADAPDAGCAASPVEISACTGSGNTIAANRGMCVNGVCFDVCNGQHPPEAYVGRSLPPDVATSLPELILLIRNGNDPNVSCPDAVRADADRQTCGENNDAGELCTPVDGHGRSRADRHRLGMCVLPPLGGIVCRDMCDGDWDNADFARGTTQEDRQQVRDVQGSYACGYPFQWLWYLLLALLLVGCILAALFAAYTYRRRTRKAAKYTRGVQERSPPPKRPEQPVDPEPMHYQEVAPQIELPQPQMFSIRYQQPAFQPVPPPSHMLQQPMSPRLQMQPLVQSSRRPSSPPVTFYNAPPQMSARSSPPASPPGIPGNWQYQPVPDRMPSLSSAC